MDQQVPDIIARAVFDAGAAVVAHVAGHGGAEVFEAYSAMAQQRHAISFLEGERSRPQLP